MSKFMFTLVAGLGLSLGLMFAQPARASRPSDIVLLGNSVGQFVLTSEEAADAKFDEGHNRGYACTYYDDRDGTGTWVVQWYAQ